jgi:uncharacterized protein YkwD
MPSVETSPTPSAHDEEASRLSRLQGLADEAIRVAREKHDLAGARRRLSYLRAQLRPGEEGIADRAQGAIDALEPTAAPVSGETKAPEEPTPEESVAQTTATAPSLSPARDGASRAAYLALRAELDPLVARLDLADADLRLRSANVGADAREDLALDRRACETLRRFVAHAAVAARGTPPAVPLKLKLAAGGQVAGTLARVEEGAIVFATGEGERRVRFDELAPEEVCALARTRLAPVDRAGYRVGRGLLLYYGGDLLGARQLLAAAVDEPNGTAKKFQERLARADERREPTRPAAELTSVEWGLASSDLAAALRAIAANDAGPRQLSLLRLEGTLAEEPALLARGLFSSDATARAKTASAIAKALPDAGPALAKLPRSGPVEVAVQEEIGPHLDAYVEKVARPAALALVKTALARAGEDMKRMASALKSHGGDAQKESGLRKREALLSAWTAARDAARDVIFNTTIYPDENHGRSGQHTVNEKVELVRAAWEPLDAVLAADASPWLALAEAKARDAVASLDDARARRAACAAFLGEPSSGSVIVRDEVSPADELFLRYRAGPMLDVVKYDLQLSEYERALFQRLGDARVLDANERWRSSPPPDAGKLPTSDELEQVRITNEYRAMMGRTALAVDPRLVASARGHSEEMTRLRYFAHESPVSENKTPTLRMKNAGYPDAETGENIAENTANNTARQAHLQWYNSSTHHRNILGAAWVAMGSGRDGNNWTQNFGAAPRR